MSDFFLSYSHEDVKIASLLANLLEANGVAVWWDRSLIPGDRFNAVIDAELEKAKAVIVLWSRKSVASDWVQGEATTAREANKLVPIKIEDCRVPIPFRAFHTPEVFKGKAELDALAKLLSEKFATRAPEGGAPPARPAVSISSVSANSFLGSLRSQWSNYSEEARRYQKLTFRERLTPANALEFWREIFKKSPMIVVAFVVIVGGMAIAEAQNSPEDQKNISIGMLMICGGYLIYAWYKRRRRS